MNAQGSVTAADIVNSYTQDELEKILRLYGEVTNARNVAQLIISARKNAALLTTDDLNNAIAPALPSFAKHKLLAKIYQALRIEVNGEMRSLEKFLEGALASLKKGGRLVVISYHSLEDRMVKHFMRERLNPLTRKAIFPCETEIETNTRARSAKLRAAEKI
jgi:16S rRNA (cytosine1402-N4)-methyltransferase